MLLKRTALFDTHQKLGAKIVPFGGYEMPLRYTSDIEEHQAVRHGVGIFDVSHMGELMLTGPCALNLIQYLTTNDASVLQNGKAQYSCMPNGKGGIVDDLLVYCLGSDCYMLVVNAANIDKDWQWINQHNQWKVQIDNISDEMSLFAVQGPLAAAALQSLTDVDLHNMEYYSFRQSQFAGIKHVIISATGYTGSGGFELYVPNRHAQHVWEHIMEAGKPYGIQPIGLAARDTLRLEMGYCLYGNDIDETTSPIEAGLGWITKLNKDFFIDKPLLERQKKEGTARRLVGFRMVERGIPRPHYTLHNEQGQTIGHVTSGTQSPSLGIGIGMGYVQTPYSQPGTLLYVAIRDKKIPAQVVKLPFYKKG
ncbi:MAG: glycine cleavage system aminomethyltransferase GcvT [Cytophagales bacterium]|nr:glycine cleavage system aminomethyltransferase GcvT [Bernardetiaceae bacterium]MDW8205461.1 glycine cleavage system aminomethyltransferase GcvT [Cytophagales bacterium]